MEKKLYRDPFNKVIGGVCAGLSEYFEIDVTIIRLLFVFALFVVGGGFVTYIVLWIVLPKKYYNPFTTPSNPATVNYIVPPIIPGEPFVPITSKKSNGGTVAGIILILLGTLFLLHQFEVIPFWELHRLWPVVLVAAGISIIISGQQKRPWDDANWHQADQKEDPAKSTDSINDNNPTV